MELFGVSRNTNLDRTCPFPYIFYETFSHISMTHDILPIKIQVRGSLSGVFVKNLITKRSKVDTNAKKYDCKREEYVTLIGCNDMKHV